MPDAVAGTGLLLASFYGSGALCLDIERAIAARFSKKSAPPPPTTRGLLNLGACVHACPLHLREWIDQSNCRKEEAPHSQ